MAAMIEASWSSLAQHVTSNKHGQRKQREVTRANERQRQMPDATPYQDWTVGLHVIVNSPPASRFAAKSRLHSGDVVLWWGRFIFPVCMATASVVSCGKRCPEHRRQQQSRRMNIQRYGWKRYRGNTNVCKRPWLGPICHSSWSIHNWNLDTPKYFRHHVASYWYQSCIVLPSL